MLRKIYEVRGMMEWHPVFTVGRTRIQVSFTGGHLCGGSATAAIFETADRVVQTVIERSEAFRSGRIRLRSQSGEAASCSREGSISVESTTQQALPEMEFSGFGEASDFLQYKRNVPVERLVDEKSCRVEARKLGFEIKFVKVETA